MRPLAVLRCLSTFEHAIVPHDSRDPQAVVTKDTGPTLCLGITMAAMDQSDGRSLAQLRERSPRSLYCRSDGVRGRGASMTNLSHNAAFHSYEWFAPTNQGIKHLGILRMNAWLIERQTI